MFTKYVLACIFTNQNVLLETNLLPYLYPNTLIWPARIPFAVEEACKVAISSAVNVGCVFELVAFAFEVNLVRLPPII